MSDNRNRERLEGRSSTEGKALFEPLCKAVSESVGGDVFQSCVLEAAIRHVADLYGLSVPMSGLKPHGKPGSKERFEAHLDRAISCYDADRFNASQKGGRQKAINRKAAAEGGGPEKSS